MYGGNPFLVVTINPFPLSCQPLIWIFARISIAIFCSIFCNNSNGRGYSVPDWRLDKHIGKAIQ